MEDEWNLFQTVVSAHPEVFRPEAVDKALFMRFYSAAQTRCFAVDGLSMVPMADCLNHNSIEVNKDICNLDFVEQPSLCPAHFNYRNPSISFECAGFKPSRFNYEVHESLQEKLSLSNLFKYVTN